jgi:hypothetical protein
MGVTSIGIDNGIIGFLLVNSRNKETTYYLLSGTNESVAAKTAEDAMPEKHYHATNPLPFSVNGLPTYIMALSDSNGIPRAYAMVDIQNYQISAVSDSLVNVSQLYERKLNSKVGSKIDVAKKDRVIHSGVVERVSMEVKNNNSVYYLMVSCREKIFVATSDISDKLPLTKVGDKIKISYGQSENKVLNLTSFENEYIK